MRLYFSLIFLKQFVLADKLEIYHILHLIDFSYHTLKPTESQESQGHFLLP